MKNFLALSITLLFTISISYGQANGDQLDAMLRAKSFTFYATSAMPQNSPEIARVLSNLPGSGGGANIILDPATYQLKFEGDSIVSFLPFFGQNFNPSMNPDDKGVKFTAKDFQYALTKNRRGNSQIDVKLKNVRAHQRLNLSITKSGYATLTVTSVDRSFISYSGYIQAPKTK